MYLKSIELVGFKSFADKTLLNFEKGITSVVGPNGSGKSNISDAIRWVMGEMSAKTLRGSAMQDVIFAGTQKRKPLGYAQVCLTLDNSDKMFKIDYEEVSITRRVYRSGESEYYINGSACRLKDIHELLMDTGLGRDGYSIIGQGKVNEIISGKADERRNIFDEAAGISKFRHRKVEAQRKLATTEENLLRITDIVSELEGRLEPLKKQSEKARKYLVIYEELKSTDINLFLDFADKYNENKAGVSADFEIVCKNISDVEKKLEQIIEQMNTLSAGEEEINKNLDLLKEQSSNAQIFIKTIDGEIDVLNNTISSSEKMIERIIGEIEGINKKTEADKLLILQKNEDVKEAREKYLELKEEVERANSKVNEANAEMIEASGEVNQKKADIIELLNEAGTYKSKQSSIEAFKQSFIDRKNAINEERSDADAEVLELEKRKEEIKAEFEKEDSVFGEMKKSLAEKKEELSFSKKLFDEIGEKLTGKNMAYNKVYSRLNMLLEMEKDFEGLSKGTKAVLNAVKNGQLQNVRVLGTLSSVVDTQKKYITAIEAAIGASLGNVITEDEFDAKKAIEYLKRSGNGRVTFLPVSSVKGREIDNLGEISKQDGFDALASRIINCDEKYRGIVDSLLGRTIIAKDMDSAIAMSRKFSYRFKIVTLEGEILNSGGSISGGSMNKSTGLLSRAGEIKELKSLLSSSKNEIESLSKDREESLVKIQKLEKEISVSEEEAYEKQQIVVRLNSDYSHIDTLIESAKNSAGDAETELLQIEQQIKAANEELAELINVTTAQEFKVEELTNQIKESEEKLEEMTLRRDELMAVAREKTVELHVKSRDIEAIEEAVKTLEDSLKDSYVQIELKEKDIEEYKESIKNTNEKISLKREEIKKAGKEVSEFEKKLSEMEEERLRCRELSKQAGDEERKLRESVYLLKEEQNRLSLKLEKLDGDMESAAAKMWESYEVTYNTALEYKKNDFVVSEGKKRLSELKGQIKQLGNVNLDAIEEYKEVSERYEFLFNQSQDIIKAKKELEQLILQLTEEMKDQFVSQFAIINEHFTETFSLLFGGGRACLKLSDPADVLESGIEIEAQPPGKSLKSMSLLSGGEMAFTAIALLFAILKVRPTPFCVLDEIEAALDEPNVYRFADYLKMYCKNTQFILVTHRRGTMEAANLLYGVTMQEKGVSKLLTLKIDEIENIK